MSKLDDLIKEMSKDFVKTETPPTEAETAAELERAKLKEFFFGNDIGNVTSGRCPTCDEPGRIILSRFFCKFHGEFK